MLTASIPTTNSDVGIKKVIFAQSKSLQCRDGAEQTYRHRRTQIRISECICIYLCPSAFICGDIPVRGDISILHFFPALCARNVISA